MDHKYICSTLKDIVANTKDCKKWVRIGKFPLEQIINIKTLMSCIQLSLQENLCCLHILIRSFEDFYNELPDIYDKNKTKYVGDIFGSPYWSYYLKQLTHSLEEYKINIE
jgi:hypothetical protein